MNRQEIEHFLIELGFDSCGMDMMVEALQMYHPGFQAVETYCLISFHRGIKAEVVSKTIKGAIANAWKKMTPKMKEVFNVQYECQPPKNKTFLIHIGALLYQTL